MSMTPMSDASLAASSLVTTEEWRFVTKEPGARGRVEACAPVRGARRRRALAFPTRTRGVRAPLYRSVGHPSGRQAEFRSASRSTTTTVARNSIGCAHRDRSVFDKTIAHQTCPSPKDDLRPHAHVAIVARAAAQSPTLRQDPCCRRSPLPGFEPARNALKDGAFRPSSGVSTARELLSTSRNQVPTVASRRRTSRATARLEPAAKRSTPQRRRLLE